jgi:hypothetical protein
MSNKTKIVLLAVVALIIGIVIGAMFAPQGSNLGSVRLVQDQFVEGLKAGRTNQFVISNAGVVTSSGALTAGAITGTTGTFTGAVSGTTGTFTGFGKFGSAASSTVQVGAASKAGCLILGDSANGASPVYIIASGATVTASTTKPAACQTVQ